MTTDPFESPRILIERAREQIGEADSNLKAFFDRKPCANVIDFDRETSQQVHKVRLTAKLPERVTAIVKDVTGNLRDALDHAVYACAVALSVDEPTSTGFPFARDAAGVTGELNGKRLSGNPPEIRAFLAAFEPHQTGNQLLWGLNRIRVPKTHRVLIPVLISAGSTSIGIGELRMAGGGAGGQIGYSKWDPAKNEVEYMRLPYRSTFKYEMQTSFDVLFGEIEAVGGQPAIGTLNAIAGEVERVVSAIEAETTRIIGARTP